MQRKHKPNLMERLRGKKALATTVMVGVTWYTPDNWARVKAAATDAERFEETYQEWEAMVEEAMVDFRKAGLSPVKVPVDSEALLAWCLAHSKPNDAESRAAFVHASLLAQEKAARE